MVTDVSAISFDSVLSVRRVVLEWVGFVSLIFLTFANISEQSPPWCDEGLCEDSLFEFGVNLLDGYKSTFLGITILEKDVFDGV